MVEIRPCREGDLAAVAVFLQAMEAAHGGSMPLAEVERALERRPEGVEILLAVGEGGELVGLASFSTAYPSSGSGLSGMLYLKELFVAPESRRQGVAAALMRRLAAIAKQRGYPRVGWTTGRDNAAAMAFYDALGATRAEWLVTYRLGGAALDALAAADD